MLVTDGRADAERIEEMVTATVDVGLRCVQIREGDMPTRELARLCGRCRAILDEVDGWLVVNDRVDIAAADLAHGVHLGWRSLTPSDARRVVGVRPVGFSAHDEGEIVWAVDQGADYVVLAPVHPTSSKPGAQALGTQAAMVMSRAVDVPVIWLGGITAAKILEWRGFVPDGVAVMSAICDHSRPAEAAAEILQAWGEVQR